MTGGDHADDDLAALLAASWDRAYRTVWLIVRDAADAEEAVQEAYLRVWRFRDSLPTGDAARGWLYRVLVNSAISQLRHDRPRRAAETAVRARRSTEPSPRSPEVAALDAETTEAVLAALADLPEHLRVPVVLRYWSDLSEREIAVAVQRRPGTVKSRLHEAKRRLAADARLASHADAFLEGSA